MQASAALQELWNTLCPFVWHPSGGRLDLLPSALLRQEVHIAPVLILCHLDWDMGRSDTWLNIISGCVCGGVSG